MPLTVGPHSASSRVHLKGVGGSRRADGTALLTCACAAALVLLANLVFPADTMADDINWVGYQFGPPEGIANPFGDASFFDADNWYGYISPASGDRAIFDAGFDPQDNGMPYYIHFGDYTRPPVTDYAPNPKPVAGGDATLAHMDFKSGNFTLDLGAHTVELTGSYDLGGFFYDALRIGYTGSNPQGGQSVVTVQGSGTLIADGLRFAPVGLAGFGGKGKLVVSGEGTTVDVGTGITMFGTEGISGSQAAGEITVENGGSMIVRYLPDNYPGIQAFEDSTILVQGTGSSFTSETALWLSDGASFSVEGGASANFSNIGGNTISNATFSVTGPESKISAQGRQFVRGTGELGVYDGGVLSVEGVTIGVNSGDTARLVLSNTGSFIRPSLQTQNFGRNIFGSQNGSQGDLQIVRGDASFARSVVLGLSGKSQSYVRDGGDVATSGQLILGDETSGEGLLQINDSDWTSRRFEGSISSLGDEWEYGAIVGRRGTGNISIENNSTVSIDDGLAIGLQSGSNGSVSVDSSQLLVIRPRQIGASLEIANQGRGELVVQNQGLVMVQGGINAGIEAGSAASILVTGGPSFLWDASALSAEYFDAGVRGVAKVDVQSGSQLTIDGPFRIGVEEGADGNVTAVDGSYVSAQHYDIGVLGQGTLDIDNFASVSTPMDAWASNTVGPDGKLTITRSGTFALSGSLTIKGQAEVLNGGRFVVETLQPDPNGMVFVDGGNLTIANGLWSSVFDVGSIDIDNGGAVLIDRGATVTSTVLGVSVTRGSELTLQSQSTLVSYDLGAYSGTVDVNHSNIVLDRVVYIDNVPDNFGTGGQIRLSNNSTMSTGFQVDLGNGELLIEQGSTLASRIGIPGEIQYSPSRTSGLMARDAGDQSYARIQGAASLWDNVDGYLTVGFRGEGTLEILDGGTAKSVGGQIARESTASGLTTINGAGSTWQIADALFVGGSDAGAGGAGNLVVENHGAAYVETELRIWQTGTVEIDDTGIVTVGEVSDNPTTGALTVGLGGALSGSGEIIGDVIFAGGTLAPGASPGTLTIDGNLLLDQLSNLKLELAGTGLGLFDQLVVTGDLRILGTIEVSLLSGFVPQEGDKFKFFDVGGALDLSHASFAFPAGLSLRSIGSGEFQVQAVPEPATSTLLLLGFALICRRLCRVPASGASS